MSVFRVAGTAVAVAIFLMVNTYAFGQVALTPWQCESIGTTGYPTAGVGLQGTSLAIADVQPTTVTITLPAQLVPAFTGYPVQLTGWGSFANASASINLAVGIITINLPGIPQNSNAFGELCVGTFEPDFQNGPIPPPGANITFSLSSNSNNYMLTTSSMPYWGGTPPAPTPSSPPPDDSLKITLTLDTTPWSGMVPPSVPPDGFLPLVAATVHATQGNNNAGIPVNFKATPVDLVQAGHDHTNLSDLSARLGFQEDVDTQAIVSSCTTDQNTGNCTLYFEVPDVSGKYNITVSAASASDTQAVTVGLSGLQQLTWTTQSPYRLTGTGPSATVTSQHGSNHWGTDALNRVIQNVAAAYSSDPANEGARLGINDMSLHFGGLFDTCNNWKWIKDVCGHAWHRMGFSVDVDHTLDRTVDGDDTVDEELLDQLFEARGYFRVPEGTKSIHYQRILTKR
jgi:hypothetical protein